MHLMQCHTALHCNAWYYILIGLNRPMFCALLSGWPALSLFSIQLHWAQIGWVGGLVGGWRAGSQGKLMMSPWWAFYTKGVNQDFINLPWNPKSRYWIDIRAWSFSNFSIIDLFSSMLKSIRGNFCTRETCLLLIAFFPHREMYPIVELPQIVNWKSITAIGSEFLRRHFHFWLIRRSKTWI